MINEAYLRAVMLGGMQSPSFLLRSLGFESVTVSEEPLGVLSLPELERLQTRFSCESTESELLEEIWRNRNYHSLSSRGEVFESINGVLRIVSGGREQKSLRSDVISRLESVYVFCDDAKIRSFLEKNAFLAPLLFQINPKIREYFGASFAVTLDVCADPENGEYQELWARIQTNLHPEEALPLLRKFDEEWWFHASVSSKNLLNIKLEYV